MKRSAHDLYVLQVAAGFGLVAAALWVLFFSPAVESPGVCK